MKMFKMNLILLSVIFITTAACNEAPKKKADTKAHHEMQHQTEAEMETSMEAQKQLPVSSDGLIDAYLMVKDALVGDNTVAAANSGQQFATILEQLQPSDLTEEQQADYTALKGSMSERIQAVLSGTIEVQRENFELLSQDLVKTVALTGTSKPLYQQYCPMFKQNQGGMWLSAAKEIRNPLFGSKMLKCGVVQTEIN